MALTTAIAGGLVDLGSSLIDRLIPDPAQKAEAKQELKKMEQTGEIEALSKRMSAIQSEAESDDPWTSRARPTFLYVFYAVIISLVIVAPVIGVAFPEQMNAFFSNVKLGFEAIPDELWMTFSAGYLGYTGFRTIEKKRRIN